MSKTTDKHVPEKLSAVVSKQKRRASRNEMKAIRRMLEVLK